MSSMHDLLSKASSDDDTTAKVVRMTKWLWVKVDVERQMQRLAVEHLAFWHFWFLFLPSATLTMVSGALAFLSTSDLVDPSNRVLLVTVVGCYLPGDGPSNPDPNPNP